MGSVGKNNSSIIDGIKNHPALQQYPNSNMALQRAIESSGYVKEDTDIRYELYKQLQNEGGEVDITNFRYKSIPDENGYADVDVSYTVTKRTYSGGKTLGGGAVFKEKKKDKYKIIRVKVLDI